MARKPLPTISSEQIFNWLNSVSIPYPDYVLIRKSRTIPFHLRARLINQYRKSPNGKILM